jgi:hypothetical protein
VFITLQVCVQFQIIKEKIYDAYYKLTDAKSQITAFVYDVSAHSSTLSTIPH